MSALWTSAEAAAATGGRLTRDWRASGVSIDTRTLRPGDLFVALSAARDGHDFVHAAFDAGASAALVSRHPKGVAEDAPLLIVPEALAGLVALARAARARARARVIAVTGSVGKTSTKEMLNVMLSGQGRVHAAEASHNNQWGVPLTMARLPADADFAVIEIGTNHPGEIAPLARLSAPHLALITTVAAAHLEAFGGLAGVAREKAAIFSGLVPGGMGIINADLATTAILQEAARAEAVELICFGAARTADLRLIEARSERGANIVRAEVHGRPFLFKLHSPGRHFALDALGALAAVHALDADLALAITDLAQWKPPPGRGTREMVRLDAVDERMAFVLIDDAFNANPASLAAALDILAQAEPSNGIGRVARGRRIAILGDMLELGSREEELHADFARYPALDAVALVHCVGPRMRRLWEALPEHKRGEWHADAEGLAARAHHIVDAGDVVLVKGSKGSRVSRVVDALRNLGQTLAGTNRGDD